MSKSVRRVRIIYGVKLLVIHVAKSIRSAVGRNVLLRCNEIFSKLNYMHEDCFFSLEKEREREIEYVKLLNFLAFCSSIMLITYILCRVLLSFIVDNAVAELADF